MIISPIDLIHLAVKHSGYYVVGSFKCLQYTYELPELCFLNECLVLAKYELIACYFGIELLSVADSFDKVFVILAPKVAV